MLLFHVMYRLWHACSVSPECLHLAARLHLLTPPALLATPSLRHPTCSVQRILRRNTGAIVGRLFPSYNLRYLPADVDDRRDRAFDAAINRRQMRAAKAKNTYQTPKK